ncbi:MAG: hypothetical protein BWY42_00024 [Candidatus Omnitrophica bacterium ADurb.Bin277]|nr:MAG: hypothetical protein BWY42_00024 [Candidatus Omnitrophica bacterium ADurb.Bin277]
MKKLLAFLVALTVLIPFVPASALAVNTATHGEITGKSVVSGLCSLIIWPGIGQYINDNETKKNWTHAIVGILPPFRFWSGWDALIQRQGGRWDGKI